MTYPTSSRTLAIRSATGLPVACATVFVDSCHVPWDREDRPELHLRGLATGPHTLVVAERGHLARRLRIFVAEREQRALELQLNPRPKSRRPLAWPGRMEWATLRERLDEGAQVPASGGAPSPPRAPPVPQACGPS